MSMLSKTVVFISGVALLTSGLAPQGWSQSSALEERIIFDARARYESVDQEWGGDAEALTLRSRIGYQSESYQGFEFLVEGEFSAAWDKDDFDAYPGSAGTPGKALIADGETAELNRAQVSYDHGSWVAMVGRQRLILDNARFIGNVGWRQNEQTYDAATFVYSPNEAHRLTYAYIDRVQRVFGSETPVPAQRRFDSESHVLSYQYNLNENNQFSGYAYDLGIDTIPSASSRTVGAFYQGTAELDNGWQVTSRLEYARQKDNGTSPAGMDFSNRYTHLLITGNKDAYSAGFGWELLSGDGSAAFSTPLATLHAFNGWADVFLSTPADGLDDQYVSGGYKFNETVSAKLFYHWFKAENGSVGYGEEIDAVVSWKVDDATSVVAKVADYNGKGEAPGLLKVDRRKFWLQVEYKY